MRARQATSAAVLLLAAAALPLRTDGANNAACCNAAGSLRDGLVAKGVGDEGFFSTPIGPPNVMVLLDNSGSMTDFPIPVVFPAAWPASGGTCTGQPLNAYTARKSNVPYDNGFTLGTLVDNPPWGLARCLARDSCLFKPTAYYRNGDWTTSTATERDAGTTNAGACFRAVNAAECRTCLDTAGFYLYRDNRGANQASFKGDFLNGYPPKHVIARKVVKNLAAIDPANPSPIDTVRFGLTIFAPNSCNVGISSALAAGDGGQLVVPLGPACNGAYPTTVTNFLPARQAIINALNNPALVPFGGCTPLAETLFNIGQYFTNMGAGSYYANHFGASWVRSSFDENQAGTSNAPWAVGNPEQHSFCWACQQSSVIVVTDGAPNWDSNLPNPSTATSHSAFNDDFRRWSNATVDCAACGNDLSDGAANSLHKVAYFLKNTDMRSDLVGTTPQTINTYTISFGIDAAADPQAIAVLQRTAQLGGGRFANASSGEELEQFLVSAASEIVARASTFSNTSTATLQVGTAGGFYIPRFTPRQGQAWEGHLYRFKLFSEFAQGCDSTKGNGSQPTISCGSRTNPNLNGDRDGLENAVCDGLYIVDQDCDPVVEGGDGGLYKGVFDGSGNLAAGTTLAVPFWDAATRLAARSDASRTVYTVVDKDGDGRFTAADGMTSFEVANVAALAPLMDLPESWCRALYARTSITPPAIGTWTAADTQKCARQVIHYVRGYDVLDSNNNRCAGPENSTACTGGELRTSTKLGDIFHSTPVTVSAPAPAFLCDLNAEPQCVATLHSAKGLKGTQTPLDPPGGNGADDAYELYRKANAARTRVVLVGANDGMLHAFHAGAAQPGTDAFGSRVFDEGTGEELWAFIPPDLLPKLKLALDRHTYFVDGTPAVRDVWVDGNGDGRKQPGEFHTVAVIAEQVGGTHQTALDVTDPLAPKFRWTFPDDCTLDGTLVGQSWTSFVPQRPPIGPVRIAGTDPTGRGFRERWIVAVNGGFDSTLARGRGIWLLDVWDGSRVWSFTNDDVRATLGSNASMGPVPGTVAMADIGKTDQPLLDFDGFFDTAVWGDMNGQLFLARMHAPGTFDSSLGKVTNWTAGRAFEEQKGLGGQTITGRHPFFELPATVWDSNFGALRAYVGTGNRSRILQGAAECNPDNLFGCCEGGCTNAEVMVTTNFGSCTVQNHYRCNGGALLFDQTSTSGSCGAISCGPLSSTVSLARVCGGVNYPTLSANLTCDAAGVCPTRGEIGAGNSVSTVNLSALTSQNRFYGIWAYSAGTRGFAPPTTELSAVEYDRGRFTDVAGSGCAGPSGSCRLLNVSAASSVNVDPATGLQAPLCSGCAATASDPGWMIQFTPVDEKVASMADVSGGGCVLWNSFRPEPSVAAASGSPCSSASGASTAITYMSDMITGTPSLARPGVSACGFTSGTAVSRSRSRSTTAPPANPVTIVEVAPGGKSRTGPRQVEPGSGGAGSGSSREVDTPVQPAYWLEVPRDLHVCRHDSPASCN